MNRTRVLFLCTGNSARSQMAEGLLREKAGARYDAFSAGLEPTQVHPMAVAAMAEIGVDISGQRSKSLTEYLGKEQFDHLITVCEHAAANCPTFPGLADRLHWSLVDPAATDGDDDERMAVFRRVRDQLAQLIDEFIADQPPH